jgi:hypothetical protein
MFILVSNITIGDYTFKTVNAVEVKRSIHDIGATAKITIPATARLAKEGEPKTAVETAKQFKAGDPVSISLGYGTDLQKEFQGYVRRVNFTIPVTVECEDNIYLLKRKDVKKSWKATTLKEVLNYIITLVNADLAEEFKVKLSGLIPDVNMTNFEIKSNAAAALGKIKTHYGLATYFDLDGVLYSGLAYAPDLGTVKYKLRYNTVEDNDLKYRSAEDVKLKAKAINIQKDNTKVEVEVGDDDGEIRTLFFYNISSQDQLKKLAEEELKKYKFNGYEGKITTLLQPYALPGMTAEIEDVDFNERSGNYYIEGIQVTYGTGGARRIIDIGIKL